MSSVPCLASIACLQSSFEQSSLLADFVQSYNLTLVADFPSCSAHYKYMLILHSDAIALQPVDAKLGGPLFVDFSSPSSSHRRQTSGIKQEVAKSVGCKSDARPSVLDVTAGLGGDAFVLASLGCKIQLLEKNPFVYLLLKDGMTRGQGADDSSVADIVRKNMQLKACQDATEYMKACLPSSVDVVYLDPMFPERKKTAKVKKAMQYFHDVVGLDTAQETLLLEEAMRVANKRVVVKRPKLAPLLDGQLPTFQLKAKSIRYDIYL